MLTLEIYSIDLFELAVSTKANQMEDLQYLRKLWIIWDSSSRIRKYLWQKFPQQLGVPGATWNWTTGIDESITALLLDARIIRQATFAFRQSFESYLCITSAFWGSLWSRYSLNSGSGCSPIRYGISTTIWGVSYTYWLIVYFSLSFYSAALHDSDSVQTGLGGLDTDTDTEFELRTLHPIPARVVHFLASY